MGIALVSQGTVAVSGTPAFGQATTAGDLLLLWAWTNDGGATDPFVVTGTGWGKAITGGGAFNWITLYYKANCGASETAPTISSGATVWSMLAEYSGAATSSPLDRTGQGASSPVTASAADRAASDLVVALAVWNGPNPGPVNMTMTIDGSAGTALSATVTNNDSAVSLPWYIWGWAINAASLGGSANQASMTIDVFENNPAVLIASFKPPGGGGGGGKARKPALVPVLTRTLRGY